MLKGIPVTLHIRRKVGQDDFNNPTYEESTIIVENVLVAPASSTDIPENSDLERKKAVYTLAVPKGDTNSWEDTIVEFFGCKWKTIGFPLEGIEELIPGKWNKKVSVERYE